MADLTPEEAYADDMAEDAYERARQLVTEWENESGMGPLFPDGKYAGVALEAFTIGIKAGYVATLETDTLRQMIADGMGQWEASRRLWGPEAPLVDPEATRAWVRAEFMRRFPWLQLEVVG